MSGLNVLRTGVRSITSASAATRGTFPKGNKYKKIMEMQTLMCADDGLLVWQKRGYRDNLMYQITVGITVLGFIPVVYAFKNMIFPPKKKD